MSDRRSNLLNLGGWLTLALAAFGIYANHVLSLTANRSLVCGKDFLLHAVLAIKYAQLKFDWPKIINLYASLEQKAYALQLHYPPLSYLSSILLFKFPIEPFEATAIANLGWMFLAILALYSLITKYTKNGFWGFMSALALLAVYWVKCTVFDIGWRIPALSMGLVGIFAFAFIAEEKNDWWRWAIIGFILGIAGLVHALAFIPVFSVILVDLANRFLSADKPTLKKATEAVLRLAGVLICATSMMSIFYLPVLMLAPTHFLRELKTEGVVNWLKVKQTFSALRHDFFELFSDNWRLTILVFAGLVVSPLFAGKPRKMFVATLLLLVSLFFGSTYNGWFYLIPYLVLILPTSVLAIASSSQRLGKIGSTVIGVLILLLLSNSLAFNLRFDECVIKDKNFCADFEEVKELAKALKTYSHIQQDKIGFVDCRSGNLVNPGDIALIAMALARPQDAASFWPYVHMVYNYQIARIQLEKIRDAQIVCVIADELAQDGTPVCEADFLRAWKDDVGELEFVERVKIGKRWAVFYQKTGFQHNVN